MANKTISNLSGGINVKVSPLIIKDSEAELIVNYNLDTTGALTKRNGYAVFATQPVVAKRVLGMAQYTNATTAAETTQVMVVNNTGNTQAVIYYNNAGTWATSKTNDTAATTVTNVNRTRFTTFLDYLFRVNGADVTGSSNNVNGSTWGTTYCPATIVPSFIAIFQARVYVARTSTNPSRVYFSSLPDSTPAITWTTADDWFDVNPNDGDEITALENSGAKLLIFKNRSMYRWIYGQTDPDRVIGIGTESQECVKTNFDIGVTFFANSKGVYAYSGTRPKKISSKIQKWIDAVPAADWNDVAAEIDNEHYYLYLSDSMTVDGVAYTNVMAVYNIPLDAWTIYALNKPWRYATKYISSSVEGIYFGSNNGRTYQWNTGLTDNSGGTDGDTATPINSEFKSKEYLLNYPYKTKLNYVDLISNLAILSSAYYKMDRQGDFLSLTSLKDRFSYSPNLNAEGRSAQLRITDNANIISRIEGFNFEHSPTTIR